MVMTIILFDLLCNHLYSSLMLGLPFAIIQGKNLMNSSNIEYSVKYIYIICSVMMMMMVIIMMMSRKDWNNDDNNINICHSLSIVLYYDDEVFSNTAYIIDIYFNYIILTVISLLL